MPRTTSTSRARKPRAKRQRPTAQKVRDLERTITLLCVYGETRFGDDWWPGNASACMREGAELETLLS